MQYYIIGIKNTAKKVATRTAGFVRTMIQTYNNVNKKKKL